MRRPLRSFEEKVAATIRNPARGTAAGARVPSALPVPRQRIPRLIAGGSATSAYILRPDTIADFDDQPVSYQGGGGQNTLNDQSDSTYLRLDYLVDPGDFYGTPVATFAATDLGAWTTVTAATLTVRARSLSNAGGNRIAWDLAVDIPSTYDPYYSTDAYMASPWTPGASWVDYSYALTGEFDALPTVAAVEAGSVQITLSPGISTADDMQLDIADVWLTLAGA